MLNSQIARSYTMNEQCGLFTMLYRGFLKRCAYCGSGALFTHWWNMRSHCPNCEMNLEREEGSWVGAMFINLTITEVSLLIFIIISFVSTWPDPPTGWISLIGVIIALVIPVFFYPFSKTIWNAIHLAMQPIESLKQPTHTNTDPSN